MQQEICIGATNMSSMLFRDEKRIVSDENCLNFRGWTGDADFEESVFQIEKISATVSESQNDLYCKRCIAQKIGTELLNLESKKNEIARLRDSLAKIAQEKRALLNRRLNLLSLKIIQKDKVAILTNFAEKKEKLQMHLSLVSSYRDELVREHLSLVSSYRDELVREHRRLKEETTIKESDLLWKKQKLSELICKRSLEYYTLFDNSWCFPEYSVNQELQRCLYENVNGEDESKYEIRIRFKTFYFSNSLSQEHRLICSYSMMNLLRFLAALFRLTNADVPFPIQLDKHGQPIVNNQSICLNQPANSENSQSCHYIDDELLIYFWINYRALYKRFQLDFNELVLIPGMFFPVKQLKQYFELWLDSANKQPPLGCWITNDFNKQENPSQNSQSQASMTNKFETELLNIKYPKNSLTGKQPALSLQASSSSQTTTVHIHPEEEHPISEKNENEALILEFDEITQEYVIVEDDTHKDKKQQQLLDENEMSKILSIDAP